MKTKGIGMPGAILGVAALLVGAAVFAGVGPFSAASDGQDTTEVKDATLNLAAEQLGSASKISTTAYATLNDGTVVTKSLSSGSFTSWSVFTNQDTVDVMAFDATNYPIAEQISFDGSTQLNEVIKTADIASASDVSIDIQETSGASDDDGAVSIAAGGQATLSSIDAVVDIQDKYWNAGVVYVEKPSNSNVTVNMPNAEAIAVPDSAPGAVDTAYRTYSPVEGANDFEEFATHKSSQVVIEGDDTNDPAETLTFHVDDVQAYQSSDTGEIEYGIEDSNGNGLGLASQSTTLTVN